MLLMTVEQIAEMIAKTPKLVAWACSCGTVTYATTDPKRPGWHRINQHLTPAGKTCPIEESEVKP